MATYATLTDCNDPALGNIEERHLVKADVYVDAALRNLGINPADVTLPQSLLTEIAANWALRLAAVEGSQGDESPLIDKAKQYENTCKILVASVTREGLGLSYPSGSSFGVVSLGRA